MTLLATAVVPRRQRGEKNTMFRRLNLFAGWVSRAASGPARRVMLVSACLLAALFAACPRAEAQTASASYTCGTTSNDGPTIQADIASVAAQGGGIVNLSGICLVSQPIMFQSGASPYANVWLKGAGVGGTILRRLDASGNPAFVLSAYMLQAAIGVPAGLPAGSTALTAATNQNIRISDLTIDPGFLFVTNASVPATATGAFVIALPNADFATTVQPNSGFAAGIGQCAPCAQVGVFDLSQAGSPGSALNPGSVAPAITLPAGGNVVSVSTDGQNTYVQLGLSISNCASPNAPVACCPPGASLSSPGTLNGTASACYCAQTTDNQIQPCYASPINSGIAAGDTLAIFAFGGVVDLEYVDGIAINNVDMVNGAALLLENDANFVVANSTFATNDDLATFNCDGGLFIGNNGPLGNVDGLVVNNVFVNSTMEIDSDNTVVSGNNVDGTTCGGINGSIGQYDVFQGNTVHDSLQSTNYQGAPIYFNHDVLVNPAIQLWNDNATIIENVAYNNGGSGLQVGGANGVVARNITYDNGQSPYCNAGLGCSGIVVQGNGGEYASQISVADNLSCNTAGGTLVPSQPDCIPGPGSQLFALDISSDVASVSVSPDNLFYPATIGNLNGIAISNVAALPEATISATPCTLGPSGTCTTTITWQSQNVNGTYVYVSNSSNPSFVQEFASAGGGRTFSQSASWIQNHIYVFTLVSDLGITLASVTLQPTNFSQ